jgi:hypothetical protein
MMRGATTSDVIQATNSSWWMAGKKWAEISPTEIVWRSATSTVEFGFASFRRRAGIDDRCAGYPSVSSNRAITMSSAELAALTKSEEKGRRHLRSVLSPWIAIKLESSLKIVGHPSRLGARAGLERL